MVKAGQHGALLAEIARQVDVADALVVLAQRSDAVQCAVTAAVVDQQNLPVILRQRVEQRHQALVEPGQRLLLVEAWDEYRNFFHCGHIFRQRYNIFCTITRKPCKFADYLLTLPLDNGRFLGPVGLLGRWPAVWACGPLLAFWAFGPLLAYCLRLIAKSQAFKWLKAPPFTGLGSRDGAPAPSASAKSNY